MQTGFLVLFAVFQMFTADYLPATEFAQLKKEVNTMMTERRGFLAFDAFSDEALKRYRSDGVTAEALVPTMIRRCATCNKN